MGVAIPQLAPASQDRVSGAQVIDGSLKFDDDASNQLKRTPTVDGNKKTWTWSGWVKRTLFGSEQVIFGVSTAVNNYAQIYIDGSDQLTLGVNTSSIGNNYIVSTRLLRDTGWYHIVAVFDSSDSTQADRLKLYVNGERITSFSASSISLSENTDSPINDNVQHVFSGKEPLGSGQQLDGHLSQCYLIDGQALTPDSFGFTDPLTNTWKPKKFNVAKADDTILVGSPTYASSDFKTEGNKTSDQTGLSFGAWTSYTGAETKIFKNSTDTVFTLNLYLTGGTTDRLLWYSNNLTDWTFVGNTNPNRYYQLSGFKYYATSEGSASTTLEAISKNGPNSFYLPFDGNSPIGQDKSVNGNDFTPVNFGGSVALDSPAVSGGKPFLNVTQGGTQAGVGVFGSKENRVYTVTYADDGGGNKYYIDGVKQPTLNGLIRGSTYTFDTVALGSTHPFRLSATSAHGTEYTDGVDATTGTATTITVPHDAPDTLYYYCTSHSGMGSSITNITTDDTKADPYASNCVLAVSFSGGRYQDDSSLLNCTTPYYAVSGSGNIATGLATVSNYYQTSCFFDGSGDSFTTPGSNTSELGMGTGDFTIEAWIHPTALASSDFIVNLTASDSVFGYDSDGTLNIQLPSSGAPALTQKGPKIVANKWNHFAVVRESGAVRGYVDGVLAATVTDTTDMGSTGKAVVGNHASLSREITGYLQDLRIYKGIAKYTSDFVVASTKPDILPDTPSGATGSKLTKITDGAVIFDGTGDKLSVPDSDDFHLGTNDFTIEYFVYKNNDMGGTRHHVGQYGTSNANRSFVIKSGQMPFHFLGFYWYNGSNEYNFNWNEGPMRTQEGWKHVCVQRKSGKLYLYIDGKMWKEETGSSAALSINNSTAPLTIGSDSNTGSELGFNGSISNFRFINGTAIYRTGGFAPPIAPLTTTSQGATESEVKLLCCQSNNHAPSAAVIPSVTTACTLNIPCDEDTFADQSASSVSITDNSISVGSAGSNTLGITTAAILPGGSGDAIDTRGTSFDRTGVYTIDCYFNYDGSQQGRLVTNYNPGTTGNTNGADGQGIAIATDGSINIYDYGDAVIAPAGSVVDNQWYHLRFIANNTAVTGVYLNGVRMPSTSTAIDNFAYNGPIQFGAGEGTVSHRFSGKLGPIRFTPGVNLGAPPLGGLVTTDSVIANNSVHTIFDAGDSAATDFNPFNTDINTVRGQEGGYATLNPLVYRANDSGQSGTAASFSDGNLTVSGGQTNDRIAANISFKIGDPGKYFWEIFWEGIPASSNGAGIRDYSAGTATQVLKLWYYDATTGDGGPAITFRQGDTLGFALNTATGNIDCFKDGKKVGSMDASSLTEVTPFISMNSGVKVNANFGQNPFKFPPPDGFQPLNTANTRPEKVFARPDQFVGVATYRGDGSSVTVSDYQFKPDLVWIKGYTDADRHGWYDSVRGVQKRLQTAHALDQDTQNGVMTFESNGFSVGNYAETNGSNRSYVGWCWKAGGDKNTFNVDDVGYASAAAAGLTGGSYSLTGASVGTKQGFSIVQWTHSSGSAGTINHGLLEAPTFIIYKSSANDTRWTVGHSSLGWTRGLVLDTNGAQLAADPAYWNSTAPTSSVFSIGDTGQIGNGNALAYCWHDIPGLQKFGTYEGNGSTDGPFVELGFKPAVLILKNVDSSENWYIYDLERSKTNVAYQSLQASSDGAEETGNTNTRVDLLSNGFKLRQANGPNNSNTYIYMAWAEAPSANLYGGGANAR